MPKETMCDVLDKINKRYMSEKPVGTWFLADNKNNIAVLYFMPDCGSIRYLLDVERETSQSFVKKTLW